jgi:hypothetical protein
MVSFVAAAPVVVLFSRLGERLHALHTVFVEDLDERVDSISARGIEPASRETYGNGVRKVIYRDPDGNEGQLRRCLARVTGAS